MILVVLCGSSNAAEQMVDSPLNKINISSQVHRNFRGHHDLVLNLIWTTPEVPSL